MRQAFIYCLTIFMLSVTSFSCKKCDCPTTPIVPTTEDIAMVNTVFSPAEKTVSVGTKVRWVNQDPYAHTVTSYTGAFDSGNMNQGQTFEFTFTTAGTYEYYCVYHESVMKGKIIVN